MQPNGFASHEELMSIYDFRGAIDATEWLDEQDDWEENDVYVIILTFCMLSVTYSVHYNYSSVARRCFLEVDDERPSAVDERVFPQQAMVQ